MYMLRKLLLNIGDLPAQTSHILFNYLVWTIPFLYLLVGRKVLENLWVPLPRLA